MKFTKKLSLFISVVALFAITLTSGAAEDSTMTRLKDGTYVVDTSGLGENVKGFRGPTPLKVYIKNNKVTEIEFLPNQETPRFFDRLRGAFQECWNGQTAAKAATLEPDGYTGATFSAEAVTENVRIALEYYQKNKK